MRAANRSISAGVKLVLAFAAVYIIWGSTYLGIRIAIETFPPFLMAGTRFLIAGGLLYGWALAHKAPMPDRRAWFAAALIGVLLLVGGNGGVTWAEQRVSSGFAALLIATEPLWIVLLNWLRPHGTRPTTAQVAGVALGFGGVILLISPAGGLATGTSDLVGASVIVLAALSWAIGSLYARRAVMPASGAQASGMQMLIGGAVLTIVSIGTGEINSFDVDQLSLRSLLAFVYLVFFGSLIAFSAYAWLVQHTTPTRAATYAYINPVVAVLLGWTILGEPLEMRTVLAALVIVGSVALITITHPSVEQGHPKLDSEPARPTVAPQPDRL